MKLIDQSKFLAKLAEISDVSPIKLELDHLGTDAVVEFVTLKWEDFETLAERYIKWSEGY